MSHGMTRGGTIVQLLSPRVSALATSSRGSSITRLAISRTVTGATPKMISAPEDQAAHLDDFVTALAQVGIREPHTRSETLTSG
ncbi:hypothetical protein [Mesorhizobium sp. CN2-181]|uniref:hypothetical protein n=1 Tax=Mesorhizobium yinganensis TaxID=3157707 RepID=UPI0032B7095C